MTNYPFKPFLRGSKLLAWFVLHLIDVALHIAQDENVQKLLWADTLTHNYKEIG